VKVVKFKKELAQMNAQSLVEKLVQLQRELFSLRLNTATAHVKDYSQFKKLRKDIARILTQLHQNNALAQQS
jgi:ribosomal protein L29